MESSRVPLMMRLGVHVVSRAPGFLRLFRKSIMSKIIKPHTVPGIVHVISHLILSITQ